MAPAKAKSPARRAISSTAKPDRGRAQGNSTADRISFGSSVVVNGPTKKSAAAIMRVPAELLACSCPSSVSTTAGYSAAPSACDSEPPIVPRLRIWKCPMSLVARLTSGARAATSALAAIVA